MFAGKTVINKAINPQPAARRKGRINKPTPPTISAVPVTAFNNCDAGKTSLNIFYTQASPVLQTLAFGRLDSRAKIAMSVSPNLSHNAGATNFNHAY